MHAEQSVLGRIRGRQLKQYGYFLRTEDSRWPKKIYQWTLHGRRRRGRPQQSWKNQVTDFMRSTNMEDDRLLWRFGMERRLSIDDDDDDDNNNNNNNNSRRTASCQSVAEV